MTESKIDKDYLFKVIVRMIGDEMHFNDIQMQKSLNILTNVFSGIEFISSENMLSAEKSHNPTIVKNFIGCKKMGGLKDSTLEQYSYSISSLLKFCQKDLVNFTTDDIRRFLLYYEQTASKTTVNNCRRNLNVFFQFMENEGYITKNPIKKIPRIKEELKYKRFYTDLEIESMRDACINRRELALIDLLISSGLRVSEVSNILISEINWEGKTILIHGKGSKDRLVPFSIRCKKHLYEYLTERTFQGTYLFCSLKKPYEKLSKSTINKLIKKIGERVGLPDITVHCFRRWLASDLSRKGVDTTVIQDILGHASFETTQKHYLSKSYNKMAYIHDVYAS